MQKDICKKLTVPLALGSAALCAALMVSGSASAATLEVLYNFCKNPDIPCPEDGIRPLFGDLLAGGSGNLFGTAVAGGARGKGVVFQLSPPGPRLSPPGPDCKPAAPNKWCETVLYNFCDKAINPNCEDGAEPEDGVISDGHSLFGTTPFSGKTDKGAPGRGTVFSLLFDFGGVKKEWMHKVLHSFKDNDQDASDGANPFGGLISEVKVEGAVGTTYYGGAPNANGGTVFKLPLSGGIPNVLHCFTPGEGNGAYPIGSLALERLESESNVYGATEYGGKSNNGVVFKLKLPDAPGEACSVKEAPVVHFFNGSDGSQPAAGITRGSDGSLYGTTQYGDKSNNGVVFKIFPGGGYTSYSFCSQPNCSDGARPRAPVIVDGAGLVYGTTFAGGARGVGVAFRAKPPATPVGVWSEEVLYNFCSLLGCNDGTHPLAGLSADIDGNLFGTAAHGGPAGGGTAFKLSGTGFTRTPFSTFSVRTLSIALCPSPRNKDTFTLGGNFTLEGASKRINPLEEPVILRLGALTIALPAGSVRSRGVAHEVGFDPGRIGLFGMPFFKAFFTQSSSFTGVGPGPFTFSFQAENVSLVGARNPVRVKLAIGDDSSRTVQFNATINPNKCPSPPP